MNDAKKRCDLEQKNKCDSWINHTAESQSDCRDQMWCDFKMDMIKREKERKSFQEVAEISNWCPTKEEATSHFPKQHLFWWLSVLEDKK